MTTAATALDRAAQVASLQAWVDQLAAERDAAPNMPSVKYIGGKGDRQIGCPHCSALSIAAGGKSRHLNHKPEADCPYPRHRATNTYWLARRRLVRLIDKFTPKELWEVAVRTEPRVSAGANAGRGRRREQIVCAALVARGYEVRWLTNMRDAGADLVATRPDGTLIIVEVKPAEGPRFSWPQIARMTRSGSAWRGAEVRPSGKVTFVKYRNHRRAMVKAP